MENLELSNAKAEILEIYMSLSEDGKEKAMEIIKAAQASSPDLEI